MIHEVWADKGDVKAKFTQSLSGMCALEIRVKNNSNNLIHIYASDYLSEAGILTILEDMEGCIKECRAQMESRLGKEMTVEQMAEEVDDGTL